MAVSELQTSEFTYDPEYPFAFLSVRDTETGDQYLDIDTNASSNEELAQLLLQALVSTQKMREDT